MADKRRSTLLAIVVLLLLFGGGATISALLLLGRDLPVVSGGRVAVLTIEGPLVSETGLLRDIERFRQGGGVRAFVVEIRSPGGTVGAAQSVYRGLLRVRETDGLPVVAWIGDVGASGGYYAALAADSIFALPGSITGSIGVILEFPNAQELLRKVGVGVEVVKSGEHKDAGSPFRPMTEEDREVLEQLVRDVWEQFVEAVVESRGLERGRAEELADGRVFTGRRAVELGLVDGIASLDEAISVAGRMAGLGDRPATVRPRERRLTLRDLLLGGVLRTDLRDLVAAARSAARPTPRLLYEWR